MQKEDCFLLGHITRRHGYKGELVAVFDTDYPQHYKNLESVFVEIHGELVPFFISALDQNSKGHFILQIEDVDADEAESMIGRNLWLPLDILPPLTGKKFYFHEVIGFAVIDHHHGLLGECSNIIETSGQPLFRVIDGDREILIPAVDEFIESINRQKKEIKVNCPEGLVELYRSKSNQ